MDQAQMAAEPREHRGEAVDADPCLRSLGLQSSRTEDRPAQRQVEKCDPSAGRYRRGNSPQSHVDGQRAASRYGLFQYPERRVARNKIEAARKAQRWCLIVV